MSTGNPLFEAFVWGVNQSKSINFDDVVDVFVNAPWYYESWWTNLVRESPHHVIVETALVLFIIWLIFIRRTVDPNKSTKTEKLSTKEVDWLLETWEPEPLVPDLSPKQQAISDSMKVITAMDGNHLTINGVSKPVLNLASCDFLGLSRNASVKKATKDALDFYGCGSCGPRGFYGTIDQHIFFEKAMADFLGTQEAISYSDSASAVSSAIPAFAKKGDLLIVDEACGEAVMNGVDLSRSTVTFFKHNDIEHLAGILQSIADDDVKLKRDRRQQRRFIIVEGLYRSTGDFCPLPQIVELKEKFFYRLILDESLSFGVLGCTGRGLTEHFDIKTADIDMVILSMDTTLASVGGVVVGSREMVDHQRLSGAGYCFSASSPPFINAAATTALKELESNPGIVARLQAVVESVRKAVGGVSSMSVVSAPMSPMVHLVLDSALLERCARGKAMTEAEVEALLILKIAEKCIDCGLGVATSKYNMRKVKPHKMGGPGKGSCATGTIPGIFRPSLIICCNATLTDEDIVSIPSVLNNAVKLYTQGGQSPKN